MQRNEGEIVLPRQHYIWPIVLLPSIGLVLTIILIWEALYFGLHMDHIRSGQGSSLSLFDVADIGAIVIATLVSLAVVVWIILRVIRHRSLSGSVYRIDQAGIQLPTPVSWLSYEPPFSTLIAWNEIKALVRYEIQYPATSQNTVPMFGIVLREYETWLARQFQEQKPGVFRRWSLRIQARKLSRLMAPINIPQGLLPISVDELMREITMRFAKELQENHVTVLDGNRVIRNE